MTDPAEYRAAARERWEQSAPGWAAQAPAFQAWAMPVSRWLVDHAGLALGQTVLELAGGPGDTGLMAAERVGPGGRLIASDGAQAMVDVARERARERGLSNVEPRLLDLESIDLPTATADAVLCRWGYMLVLDPASALRETRRVLRPGGRVALAVWDQVDRNPWAAPAGRELVERGLIEAPKPGDPGMFALAEPGALEALLGDAGFTDLHVDALDLEQRHPNFVAWWRASLDLSLGLRQAVERLDDAGQRELRDAMRARLAPYAAPDGALALPARTLVAAASA